MRLTQTDFHNSIVRKIKSQLEFDEKCKYAHASVMWRDVQQ
jgi:hypothetical protein